MQPLTRDEVLVWQQSGPAEDNTARLALQHHTPWRWRWRSAALEIAPIHQARLADQVGTVDAIQRQIKALTRSSRILCRADHEGQCGSIGGGACDDSPPIKASPRLVTASLL